MSGQVYCNIGLTAFYFNMGKAFKILTFALFTTVVYACNESADVNDVSPYDGAMLEVANMETLYSDSAIVRVKVKAPKQLEYENGDSEFPEGVYIEFYDVNRKLTTTIEADKGHFDKKENLYTATGDVEVNSIEKKEKLNTEVLYWKEDKQEIYTDKFVRIETADEILLGEGLTASQDFSSYRILKPTGELSIEQD